MSRLRRALPAVLLVVIAACSRERGATKTPPPEPTDVATPSASPTPTPVPTPNLSYFRIEHAMEHVRAIGVEIGRREAGTEGDRKAAAYISSEIEELGWTVREQAFPLPEGAQGTESSNVIGTPPRFDDSEPYVIVGGHRDSLRGPGANDNATGIAAMLEIARAIRVKAARLPVVLVAFGAEERQFGPGSPHHIGSEFYVSKMSQQARDNLAALVNLDMIGRGDVITCGRMSVGPRDGTDRCLKLGQQLGIAVKERVTPNWSDNGSFLTEGMNAAWLWTGDDPCCYHNLRDTIDRVQPHDLARSGKLALAIVRSYSPSDRGIARMEPSSSSELQALPRATPPNRRSL